MTQSHGLSSISSFVNGDLKKKKSDLLVDWIRHPTTAAADSFAGKSLLKDG
jgi:hypothetical protein